MKKTVKTFTIQPTVYFNSLYHQTSISIMVQIMIWLNEVVFFTITDAHVLLFDRNYSHLVIIIRKFSKL